MKITRGLMDGQVLQRNAANRGRVAIGGTAESDGRVEARLGGVRSNSAWGKWRPLGEVVEGRFALLLEALPCGGPYKLELRVRAGRRIADRARPRTLYVGDVWILAGQSNMQGCGLMQGAPPPHPKVRSFSLADRWEEAREPLHMTIAAADAVHYMPLGFTRRPSKRDITEFESQRVTGVGPGLHFAKEMARRTRVPQGLIPCAHGGTSMDQWSQRLKSRRGRSLYGAMLRRYRKLAQPVRGVLWYQGESDAPAPDGYTEKMIALIGAVRQDFGLARLPWVIVQIGRVMGGYEAANWNAIQEAQRRLHEQIEDLDMVPTADLELDDNIHISAADHRRLGHRLARAAWRLCYDEGKAPGGIALGGVKCVKGPAVDGRGFTAIDVAFSNVKGSLSAGDRPTGFTLATEDGRCVDAFFKVTPRGSKVRLYTASGPALLESMVLHYGYGTNPAVNIADADDMALPVFGPIRVLESRGTRFLMDWKVRRVSKDSVDVRRIDGPAMARRGSWKASHDGPDAAPYMAMPLAMTAQRGGTFVMKAAVTATRAFECNLAFGADSPFQVWWNGQSVILDATATNPCVPDEYEVPVGVREGRNEVVLAFDSRRGQGWGVSVRFKPRGGDSRIAEGVLGL